MEYNQKADYYLLFRDHRAHLRKKKNARDLLAASQGRGGGGGVDRSPGALKCLLQNPEPHRSVLGALTLFICGAWNPRNVCLGARSPTSHTSIRTF